MRVLRADKQCTVGGSGFSFHLSVLFLPFFPSWVLSGDGSRPQGPVEPRIGKMKSENIWRGEQTKVASVAWGLPAEGMMEPLEIPIALAHLRKRKGKEIPHHAKARAQVKEGERGDNLLVQASRQDFHFSLFSHAVFTGSAKVLMPTTLSSMATATTVLCPREFLLRNEVPSRPPILNSFVWPCNLIGQEA